MAGLIPHHPPETDQDETGPACPHIMANEWRQAMAGGWTRDGAVQDQIDDTVMDAVLAARAQMPAGESELYCTQCGDDIPEGRRRAVPGVRTCVACQSGRDRAPVSTINRRGSKDSQLR